MTTMASNWWEAVLWALRAKGLILIIDFILLAIWMLLQSASLIVPVRKDFLAVLLLLESALVFLTGGAVAMSTSIFPTKIREYFFRSKEKWSAEKHKKSEARANLYILVGVFLLLESVGFALFL